ncbi:MAG: hypothetical protein P4L22_04905 [Candidatus Babeliales bacterium]|nr:hypothetical protein [Candidatus Babeliales bacterium]
MKCTKCECGYGPCGSCGCNECDKSTNCCVCKENSCKCDKKKLFIYK